MSRDTLITLLQSIAVVLVCGFLGLSIARVTGADSAVSLAMSLGGAVVGLIAVVIGILVRSPTREWEHRRNPHSLLGLRIATVGTIIAVSGWLLAVFVSGELGWLVGVAGALSGGAGILVHNISLAKGAK